MVLKSPAYNDKNAARLSVIFKEEIAYAKEHTASPTWGKDGFIVATITNASCDMIALIERPRIGANMPEVLLLTEVDQDVMDTCNLLNRNCLGGEVRVALRDVNPDRFERWQLHPFDARPVERLLDHPVISVSLCHPDNYEEGAPCAWIVDAGGNLLPEITGDYLPLGIPTDACAALEIQ